MPPSGATGMRAVCMPNTIQHREPHGIFHATGVVVVFR